MTVLPSPVPHPLDFCPWDLPPWAYEALEWVVGFQWPDGDENATWDIADRWYALADTLDTPRHDASQAAGQIIAGYGGIGVTVGAFRRAWQEIAADEQAPLNTLLAISHEIGAMVEECGCDIEGAKLEAWIELGIFVIELLALAAVVAVSLGAASPAAGGLIAATRFSIQQIFRRLLESLSRKAVKQSLKDAGDRAVKQLTTRAGLARLGHEGVRAGVEEAGEELVTNASIQAYQNSTGRRDGVDRGELGMSAAAGFAGGAAASGATIGRGHGPGGNPLRGAAGEVLGEFGAAAVSGRLPDLEDIAKASTSGATGAAIQATRVEVPASLAGLEAPGLPTISAAVDSRPAPPGPDLSALAPPTTSFTSTPTSPGAGSVTATQVPAALQLQAPALSSPAIGPSTQPDLPTDAAQASTAASPAPPVLTPSVSLQSSGLLLEAPPAPPNSPPPPTAASSPPPPVSPMVGLTPLPAPPSPAPPPPPPPPTLPTSQSPATPAFSASIPSTLPLSPPPLPPSPTQPLSSPPTLPSPSLLHPPLSIPPSPPPPLVPQPLPNHMTAPTYAFPPAAHSIPPTHAVTALWTNISAAPGPEERYVDRLWNERLAYAKYRRHEEASFHERQADRLTVDERAARRAERIARFLTLNRHRADAHRATAEAFRERAGRHRAYAKIVRESPPEIGDVFVDRVHHWARLNTDVEPLARRSVWTGDISTLTGSDDPPPIDRSREYGVPAGLRPPLAQHQIDLELAVPRDDAGVPQRGADPRLPYFRLVNDGGPLMDPTRGINCQDCVLSFYETYMHGRPRVSAPRTFDAYVDGNVARPAGGEAAGIVRTEQITGGRYQSLCDDVSGDRPESAKQRVDKAFAQLEHQLHAGGPGSFAFLINAWESGAAHSWCAVNQGGEILYLDPQSGRVAGRTVPGTVPTLHHHTGVPDANNVTRLDALVVSAQGQVLEFADAPNGYWHEGDTTPTGEAPHNEPPPSDRHDPPGVGYFTDLYARLDPAETERGFLNTLSPAQRAALKRSVELAADVADRAQYDLTASVSAAGDGLYLVDLEHRLKTAPSLARAFRLTGTVDACDLESFVGRQKDRVRFSVVVPENGYVAAVGSVLNELVARGYRVGKTVNFWRGDGRHNGLNVAVHDTAGFPFEVQFPTALSRACGKETHRFYETIRLVAVLPVELVVDAYFRTLAVNQRFRMASRVPVIERTSALPAPIDTTFAKWFGGAPAARDDYGRWLRERDLSLDEMIRRHGLDPTATSPRSDGSLP